MIAALSSAGRLSHRLWRLVAAAVVLAGLLAGCAGAGSSEEPLPPEAATVEVRLADDELSLEGRPVPAGRVVFEVRNVGEHDHRLTLAPIGDDRPPMEQDVADETERPIRQLARVPTLKPGETGTFAVDLAPDQRYAMVDYAEAPDGTQYMDLGVVGEFRTQPAGRSTSSPGPASPSASSQGGAGRAWA